VAVIAGLHVLLVRRHGIVPPFEQPPKGDEAPQPAPEPT
jgi:hypothetical protein